MGGNVFGDKAKPISKEYIIPTLNAYFDELKRLFPRKEELFNYDNFIFLGSTGKKDFSGDIDLGIDLRIESKLNYDNLMEWNLKPSDTQKRFLLLKKRARTSTDEQLKQKAFLQELATYINKNSHYIKVDEKKIESGGFFTLCPQKTDDGDNYNGSFVQVDWIIGDLEWLKFSYYSSVYSNDSNIKGLHRTQLLLSILEYYGYSFSHTKYVKDKVFSKIYTKPEEVLMLLTRITGYRFTEEIVSNYYSLIEIVERCIDPITPLSPHNGVIDIYLKILDRTRCDIPIDLQNYWILNKERLELKGKFLPDNSNLKELIK